MSPSLYCLWLKAKIFSNLCAVELYFAYITLSFFRHVVVGVGFQTYNSKEFPEFVLVIATQTNWNICIYIYKLYIIYIPKNWVFNVDNNFNIVLFGVFFIEGFCGVDFILWRQMIENHKNLTAILSGVPYKMNKSKMQEWMQIYF